MCKPSPWCSGLYLCYWVPMVCQHLFQWWAMKIIWSSRLSLMNTNQLHTVPEKLVPPQLNYSSSVIKCQATSQKKRVTCRRWLRRAAQLFVSWHKLEMLWPAEQLQRKIWGRTSLTRSTRNFKLKLVVSERERSLVPVPLETTICIQSDNIRLVTEYGHWHSSELHELRPEVALLRVLFIGLILLVT